VQAFREGEGGREVLAKKSEGQSARAATATNRRQRMCVLIRHVLFLMLHTITKHPFLFIHLFHIPRI